MSVCLPNCCAEGALLCSLCCCTCVWILGWARGSSGQIREVETDDVVLSLISTYGMCTVSFFLRIWEDA